MSISSRLSRYLDAQGARYEVLAHDPSHSSAETARTAHVPPHELAKSVLLEDGIGCVLVVLPADRTVAVRDVAEMLGRKELRLADENRIAALFDDCDPGAVPPVGMAWGIETIVDDELEANDAVYMEGGDHQCLLRMSRDQFRSLMSQAVHGRICKSPMH